MRRPRHRRVHQVTWAFPRLRLPLQTKNTQQPAFFHPSWHVRSPAQEKALSPCRCHWPLWSRARHCTSTFTHIYIYAYKLFYTVYQNKCLLKKIELSINVCVCMYVWMWTEFWLKYVHNLGCFAARFMWSYSLGNLTLRTSAAGMWILITYDTYTHVCIQILYIYIYIYLWKNKSNYQ